MPLNRKNHELFCAICTKARYPLNLLTLTYPCISSTSKYNEGILNRIRKKCLLSNLITTIGRNLRKSLIWSWTLRKLCTHTKKNLVHTWSVLGTTHISPCLCRSGEVITIRERINFIVMKTCLENTALKDFGFYTF